MFSYSFGTIRNNTALKRCVALVSVATCFGTIRNNTALKLPPLHVMLLRRFGTIRNNTALKQAVQFQIRQ